VKRLLYRVAAVLILLFDLGHTSGYPWSDPRWGVDLRPIQSIHFDVLGSSRSYWDFYVGFGLSETVFLLLAAVLVFFVVFFNAYQGVREVDGNLVNNARILGASRLQVIRNVVLPSAMTWIIASLHVAFGFAVIGAIVGEILGAQKGLGLVIVTSMNNFNPDGVFAAMFIIAAIALTHRKRRETKYQNPSEQIRVRRDERLRILNIPAEKREP